MKPWRFYGRYALVYLFDGVGHHSDTRGIACDLAPGDLVVVRPGLGHAYGARPDGHWREYYVAFDGPLFDLWAQAGLLLDAVRPVLRLEPVDEWLRHFAGIVSSSPGSGDSGSLDEECRLQTLLTDIVRAEGRADPTTPGGFRKRFTRQVGQPPARYRLARRIDQACERLSRGGLSVKEAAAATGFCDEFHFSRRFKQITGESSSRFRQRMRQGGGKSYVL